MFVLYGMISQVIYDPSYDIYFTNICGILNLFQYLCNISLFFTVLFIVSLIFVTILACSFLVKVFQSLVTINITKVLCLCWGVCIILYSFYLSSYFSLLAFHHDSASVRLWLHLTLQSCILSTVRILISHFLSFFY